MIDWTHPPYIVGNVTLFPPILSPEYTMKRSSAQAEIKDMLVAELGDEVARYPYLIVSTLLQDVSNAASLITFQLRTTSNEIILYEPFHAEFNETKPWESSTLQFLKIFSPSFTRSAVSWSQEQKGHEEDNQSCALRALPGIGGYFTVFIPGESPCFLLKSAASSPKLLRVRERTIVGASGFHTKNCEKGWVYFDDEVRLDQTSLAYAMQTDTLFSGCCTISSVSSKCCIGGTGLASKEDQPRRRSASIELSCSYGKLCSWSG